MLFFKNWKEKEYWPRYKKSFKKNPISHLILLFVGSQFLIAFIATVIFMYTGLGLFSKVLATFTLWLVIIIVILAALYVPVLIFFKIIITIAEEK